MRFHYLLFVAATVLLSSTSALSASATASETKSLFSGQATKGRFLRASVVSDNDVNDEIDSTNSEERGGLSSLFSKISSKIPIDVKLAWWQHVSGKSIESVKIKLGLAGLEGVELTGHKNYPRLVKYINTAENNKLWELANRGYPTYQMWKDMGLPAQNGVTVKDIIAQLKEIRHTEQFKSYRRYANEFDEHIIATFDSGYYRPTTFFDKNATPLERMARVEFWAEKERHDSYVKEFLGLLRADPRVLSNNAYYQYFLTVSAQIKAAKAKAT